jgi:hypothetical protein
VLLGVGVCLLAVAVGCFTIHTHNSRYLLEATDFIFNGPGDDESKAKALVHFVATQSSDTVDPQSASLLVKIEHTLPLELSPVTVLKEGANFPDARRYGSCGQLSRTVRAVAWLRHIPSHKVLMGTGAKEHAMVALYVNGRYRLFDPTYDFYWTDSTGHVASIEDVRGDTAIFAQIYRKVPDYAYNLSDASYLRWSRLGPLAVPLKSALTAVMGAAWVENIDTPKLYERPWYGYGWASLTGSVLCLVLGFTLMKLRGRARAG